MINIRFQDQLQPPWWIEDQQKPPPSGVRFGSRHDDRFRMWALFEQPGEDETGSRRLTGQLAITLTVDTPELLEAFAIFGLTWN